MIGYQQRDIAAGKLVLLLAQPAEGGVLPEQVLGADAAHGEDDPGLQQADLGLQKGLAGGDFAG